MILLVIIIVIFTNLAFTHWGPIRAPSKTNSSDFRQSATIPGTRAPWFGRLRGTFLGTQRSISLPMGSPEAESFGIGYPLVN
jgi:hypothetical protein